MTKLFITTITAVALIGAASTSAFAKPMGNHHHNHWHGGGLYISGIGIDQPECYMVTKYNRFGQPYLVEVCG